MERSNLSETLEIKNLHKSFGGVKAVDGCNFEIVKGKIVALIGPNGSGKTTVFNLISGIIYPDSGEILLEGNNIGELSIEERSQMGISRLFQQSRLFANLTVRENLLLAIDQSNLNFFSKLKGSKSELEKMEEILNLFELKNKQNIQVKNLSYGQKRLIEIAQTFLCPHKILLFDEPVAGVTQHLRDEISKFLNDLRNKGETVFIIEHDMNFVFNLVDEIIVMDSGKCIARGSAEEIKRNHAVKAAYLGE